MRKAAHQYRIAMPIPVIKCPSEIHTQSHVDLECLNETMVIFTLEEPAQMVLKPNNSPLPVEHTISLEPTLCLILLGDTRKKQHQVLPDTTLINGYSKPGQGGEQLWWSDKPHSSTSHQQATCPSRPRRGTQPRTQPPGQPAQHRILHQSHQLLSQVCNTSNLL